MSAVAATAEQSGDRIGDQIAVADLVRNLATGLEQMSALATDIDNTIGDWLASGGAGGGAPNAEVLQNVDLLRQSAGCFERLMRNLAEEDIGPARISSERITEGVYLERVRRLCVSDPG